MEHRRPASHARSVASGGGLGKMPDVAKAKLVLVIENPLPKKNHWMEDYLINDRGVLLVWDGDGKFHCPPSTRKQLEFLT